MKTLTWKFRGSPETSFAKAVPPFEAEVELDDETFELCKVLGQRYVEAEAGSETRSKLLSELQTLMELAHTFDARIVSGPPTDAQGASERGDQNGTQQMSMLPPPEGTPEFPIPPKARRAMAEKSGYAEQDNAGSGAPPPPTPPPAPPSPEEPEDEDELPDPGRKRIGEFSDPAKTGAPDTQREAAISVYYSAGADCLKVLEVLWSRGADRDAPRYGVTDYEIEVALQMKHQTASARRNQLMNDGWVRPVVPERKRPTDTGRKATVYEFSDLGRKLYEEKYVRGQS